MQRVQFYRLAYCEVCKRPMRTARKHTKTCSPACRKARSRAGQKDKPKNVNNVTLHQLELLVRKHADKR